MLTRLDYIYMTALVFVFSILAFFRLGNTYAPETCYLTDSQNCDIVLDFGEYIDVATISVFLGNQNTRHFSISAFNETPGSWRCGD